jgi:BirA family transcriptional regulator, biotin operon repressor / biotin---[acetyl-CoA-carboxylase] ligase
VATTIRKLFRLKAELKWPNDVLIQGKKVCGILAEMDAEMDVVNFVNVGIGVNANSSVAHFERTATSLKDMLGREVSRKDFLRALLAELERRESMVMESALLDEWRKLSATLNKNVRIVSQGEELIGQATDIDTTGALIVKGEDGALRTILAGDCIHLRGT